MLQQQPNLHSLRVYGHRFPEERKFCAAFNFFMNATPIQKVPSEGFVFSARLPNFMGYLASCEHDTKAGLWLGTLVYAVKTGRKRGGDDYSQVAFPEEQTFPSKSSDLIYTVDISKESVFYLRLLAATALRQFFQVSHIIPEWGPVYEDYPCYPNLGDRQPPRGHQPISDYVKFLGAGAKQAIEDFKSKQL